SLVSWRDRPTIRGGNLDIIVAHFLTLVTTSLLRHHVSCWGHVTPPSTYLPVDQSTALARGRRPGFLCARPRRPAGLRPGARRGTEADGARHVAGRPADRRRSPRHRPSTGADHGRPA